MEHMEHFGLLHQSLDSRMMLQALYNAAANALLIFIGMALYYNYLLLEVYITPMLWALLFSVVLRAPKNSLYTSLEGFLKEGPPLFSGGSAVPRRMHRGLSRHHIVRVLSSFPFGVGRFFRSVRVVFGKFLDYSEVLAARVLGRFNEGFLFAALEHRKKRKKRGRRNSGKGKGTTTFPPTSSSSPPSSSASSSMSSSSPSPPSSSSTLKKRKVPKLAKESVGGKEVEEEEKANREAEAPLSPRRVRIRSSSVDRGYAPPFQRHNERERGRAREAAAAGGHERGNYSDSEDDRMGDDGEEEGVFSWINIWRGNQGGRKKRRGGEEGGRKATPPSAFYFRLLYGAYALYFGYSFLLPMWYGIISVIFVMLVSSMVVGIVWALAFGFCLIMGLTPPSDLFDLFCLVTIDPVLWTFSILDTSLGSPCQRFWKAVVVPLATSIALFARRILLENLHGFVAFVIVTAGMAAMGIFGTFFAFQCAGEAQEAIGAVQSLIEQTMSQNPWLAEQNATRKHFEMLTEEGLRSFERTMGLNPATFNQTHPLRGILQDMYSNYIVGLAPANVSLYDKERLASLFNMSASLQFGDPQYWRTLQELFRESALATRTVLAEIQHPSFGEGDTGFGDFMMDLEVNDLLTQLDLSSLVTHTFQILAGSGQVVWHGSTALVSALIGTLVMGCFSVLSFGLSVVLFVSCLFYLLKTKDGVLSGLTLALPFDERIRRKVIMALSHAISGVFVSAFKVGLYHASLTWISFRVTGIPFAYLGCLISGILAVMPFAPSFIIGAIAAIDLWNRGRLFLGLVMFLLHYSAYFFIDTIIYSEIPNAHPYLVGLSLISGVYAFELQGVVLGPTLLTIPVILYSLYAEFISDWQSRIGGRGRG